MVSPEPELRGRNCRPMADSPPRVGEGRRTAARGRAVWLCGRSSRRVRTPAMPAYNVVGAPRLFAQGWGGHSRCEPRRAEVWSPISAACVADRTTAATAPRGSDSRARLLTPNWPDDDEAAQSPPSSHEPAASAASGGPATEAQLDPDLPSPQSLEAMRGLRMRATARVHLRTSRHSHARRTRTHETRKCCAAPEPRPCR